MRIRTHDWGLATACSFEQDSTTVAVQTWVERFHSGNTSPLFFRRAVRHALRSGPSIDAGLLRWIPADPDAYHLEILATQEDWMRVRLVQPSDYCAPGDDGESTRTEGWIRWHDEKGPWLWYYTRGC